MQLIIEYSDVLPDALPISRPVGQRCAFARPTV